MPTTLPSATTATAATATEGDVKNFLTNLRAYLSGLFGDTGVAADARAALGITAAPNMGAQLFTASGTFTVPSGVTSVLVTVVGGGGGAGDSISTNAGGNGGYGGAARAYIPSLTPGASITVTVGAGGAATSGSGSAGGTSSFGAYLSCTGGGGGKDQKLSAPRDGANGTYSVSSGTVVEGLNEHGGESRPSHHGLAAVGYSISGSYKAGTRGTTAKDDDSSGGVGGKVLIEW